MGKSILILGGGIGGLVVSNLLRKKLGKEHRVILVEKKVKFEFTPSMFGSCLDGENYTR